jgi:hypothetical protein
LWAILAGAAIYNKDLETASYAYAALNEVILSVFQFSVYILESIKNYIHN